ncbi:MAG: hypothetical protein L0215_23950 [Gemmataceae bacterium]|nr:hypothetical protein [Gemmataceae bacterium]
MKQPVIGLLGAEKQSAVSAALAWPERRFLLVSDQPVLDGWDLSNVEFRWAAPTKTDELVAQNSAYWIPLCPRWLSPALGEPHNRLADCSLHAVLNYLAESFPEAVLPVQLRRPERGECFVKGNHWRRPDAPLFGPVKSLAEIHDPYGCGIVYQEAWPKSQHVLAIGRRWQNGAITLALVLVHSEACARDDVLAAGETFAHAALTQLTLAMLETLQHCGFFTLNWLVREEAFRLSSIRPAPRAVFRTLRRAGLEVLEPESAGVQLARPGLKFAVDIHYSSYHPLDAAEKRRTPNKTKRR